MAVSKAQQRAVNKYMAANYDRINLTVPKGKKDTIQAYAEAQGQSVNAYINAAIDEKMAREAAGSPTSPADGGVVSWQTRSCGFSGPHRGYPQRG